jgi:ubiquinone/menaquinone biosynthesis C-methylase UbiE
MEELKADYGKIAASYDQVRPTDRPHVEWWVRRLIEAGELTRGKQLLDLGCGTGRWGLLLAERAGCRCVGVDTSPEMLAKARQKDRTGLCTWVEGHAADPPVALQSCDCVLMSLLLHFLPDVPAVFRAAFSRLREGGILLVRQPTLEQAAGDPIHRFFPESLAIERQRTPLSREIEFWLEETSFSRIQIEPVRHQNSPSLSAWFEKIRLRVPSILHLLSDDVFLRGQERCCQFMREHPDDTTLLENEMTLFVARKDLGARQTV